MKIEIIITISILLLLFVGFFSSWVSCWWCQERLMKESIRLDWVFSRSLPFSRDFHSLSILYDSWELSWSRRALSNCCFHSHWNLFILMLFKVKFPTFNVNIFAMAVNNLRASAKVLSSRYGEFNKLFKSRNFRYFRIFCRDFWYNQLVSKISPNYLKISTKIYYHSLTSSYLNVKHFILSLCCHCGCFSLCFFPRFDIYRWNFLFMTLKSFAQFTIHTEGEIWTTLLLSFELFIRTPTLNWSE